MAKVDYGKIAGLRRYKNISQRKIGKLLGITQSGYQKTESGLYDISAIRLYEIAKMFNEPIESFFVENVSDGKKE
jgi:transcriptional regulator with XRE-family HTH domain